MINSSGRHPYRPGGTYTDYRDGHLLSTTSTSFIAPSLTFSAAGKFGYTARAALETGRRNIVPAKSLIGEFEAFLCEQKLGETGVVFLFDNRGRIVAHPLAALSDAVMANGASGCTRRQHRLGADRVGSAASRLRSPWKTRKSVAGRS